MRPLTLNVSALTDAEYSLYIPSLRDLAAPDDDAPDVNRQDAYYEALQVGAREARAWLRGRFPTIPQATVDSLLRLFCPDLAPSDTLTGGQFFAALRLVTHVLAGKQLDRTLVFVQAYPAPQGEQLQPFAESCPPSQKNPQIISSDPLPSSYCSRTPDQPSSYISLMPGRPQSPSRPVLPPKPTNPFLSRRVSQDVSRPMIPGTDRNTGFNAPPRAPPSLDGKLPPLPPRKPVIPPPPPRHSSLLVSGRNTSGSANPPNVLIQQSLQATRVAQSLKKAEQRLEKERVLEVLKSSSRTTQTARSVSPLKGSPASSASTSSSVERPPATRVVPTLPPRPIFSPPASTIGSSRSFESVAHATVFRHASPYNRASTPTNTLQASRSPSRTPPRSLADLPSEPPPTHPDRRPSLGGFDSERPAPSLPGTPRVLRSRSMHHPSPPPVPPPLARKRPESVQLAPPSPSADSFSSASVSASSPARSQFSAGSLSRHLSLSGRAREDAPTPIAHLQKTLSGLQLKAQPRLDSARYKAEAGLTRRGFVQHSQQARWIRKEGEESLLDGVGGDEGLGTDDGGVDQDTEEVSETEWEARVRRLKDGGDGEGRRPQRAAVDREAMKWPAGEGWKQL